MFPLMTKDKTFLFQVTLTYLVEADVEEEKTRLTLPTTLAPRYCPPTHRTPETAAISSIRHTDSSPPLSLKLDMHFY